MMREEPLLWQKLAAEFLGTAMLVLFGAGSVTATFTLQPRTNVLTEADLGIIALWGVIGLILALRYFSWEPRR